jgi:hypothetical protein
MSHAQTKKSQVKRCRAGLGLFATKGFLKGDFVTEYTGERISTKEANRRGGKYLFELTDNWTIDGKGRENNSRYINHSCAPNCHPELYENETKIFIYAKKNIAPNEELTYDYGKDYFSRIIKPLGCKCTKCTLTQ